MFLYICLVSSLGDFPKSRIISIIHPLNLSLVLKSEEKNYLNHPLFLFSKTLSQNSLKIQKSSFSGFVNHAIKGFPKNLYVERTKFRNSLTCLVYLGADNSFSGKDFQSRFLAINGEAKFSSCSFQALVSKNGNDEEKNGGAIYANGYNLEFIDCLFTGNTAVSGGSCYLNNSFAHFEKSNFSLNHATSEGGAMFSINSIVEMKECIFVKNKAELSSGAIRMINTTYNSDSTIFHENRALSTSAVIEADFSRIKMESNQFSANKCEFQPGGTVIVLSSSTCQLLACYFSISAKKKEIKKPISSDSNSSVSAKLSCFDIPSDQVSKYIGGVFKESPTNQYNGDCPYLHVEAQQPFDVLEFSESLPISISNKSLIIIIFSLISTIALVTIVMYKNSRPKSQYTKTI